MSTRGRARARARGTPRRAACSRRCRRVPSTVRRVPEHRAACSRAPCGVLQSTNVSGDRWFVRQCTHTVSASTLGVDRRRFVLQSTLSVARAPFSIARAPFNRAGSLLNRASALLSGQGSLLSGQGSLLSGEGSLSPVWQKRPGSGPDASSPALKPSRGRARTPSSPQGTR
jgi:hypothetical protein